ncbi:unnamed protein product [Paramecium primaurelia]|uniref:RING-CH-type domain-containing protein n=1 Tax=Paramecium primaurelia TaxID=5886 RepID=A0A8S1KY19_PARPR|nr:unnamed protein product [Paramecium primaurelia]
MANETFRITPTGTCRIPFSFMGSQQQEINLEVIKEKPTREQTQRDFIGQALSPNASTIKRSYNNETDIELQNNPFYMTPVDYDCSNSLYKTPQQANRQNPKFNPRITFKNRTNSHRQQDSLNEQSTSNKNINGQEFQEVQVKVFEERQCKFCNEQDWSAHLIRPCQCKASQQYAHQKCVQNEIEVNYMDFNRRQFIKRLQCDFCRFQYVIKTYKEYSLMKSLKDPLKFNKLFWLMSSGVILASIIVATMILISLNIESMRSQIESFIITIIGCLVCIILVIILIFNIFELIVIFEWKVMDKDHQNIEDHGLRMNQDELNLMLELARQKLDKQISQIYPQQHSQIPY